VIVAEVEIQDEAGAGQDNQQAEGHTHPLQPAAHGQSGG